MSRKTIGIYELGREKVRLIAESGFNGYFDLLPKDSLIANIGVGLGHEKWWQCLRTLTHETWEFAMTRQNCRYDPNQDMGHSSGAYLFVMDHEKFADVCGYAIDFISSCQLDLRKAWDKYKKERRKPMAAKKKAQAKKKPKKTMGPVVSGKKKK